MPSFLLRAFENGFARVFPLQSPVATLGSAAENDLVLSSHGIPDVALRLVLAEGGFEAAVVDPKAKVLWNGKRETRFPFRPGDLVEIGACRLLLDAETVAAPAGSIPGRLAEGVAKLCALVAEEREQRTLLSKCMARLLEAFQANEALLFTVDGEARPLISVSTRGPQAEALFSDTIVQEVLLTGKGLHIGNALLDPAYAGARSVVDLSLRSVVCCPIRVAGQVTGLIYLGSNRPSVAYGEADLRDAEAFAMLTGCLLNHLGFIEAQGKLLGELRGSEGPGFVATSPVMRAVVEEARAVAQGPISVLLQGETGTGKDVLAQFIHRSSPRAGKPFLVVNCGTLRGELLASELFGHKKGSFTGALQDRRGIFQDADGGTLFLDEIGEMDLPLQAMLLRTLETGNVRPVGQSSEVHVDVRVLSATNRDLPAMVAEGRFREDLYYRINQHSLALPPLRDRGEDVILLAHHFLAAARARYPQKAIGGFHPESLFAMARYAWPGNIRELANAVHKAVLLSDSPAVRVVLPGDNGRWMDFEEATRRFQLDYLRKAVDLCGGDKERAAKLAGIGRSTLFRYLSEGASPQ